MEVRGAVVTRNRGAAVVAVLAALSVVGVTALAILTTAPAALIEYPVVVLLGALSAHLGYWRSKERAADLRADAEGVHVDGLLVRAKLEKARILPRDRKPPIVELRRRNDVYPMRVVVPTNEDAQAFVRALGLDPRAGMTAAASVTIGTDGILVFGLLGRRFVPWSDVVDLVRMVPPERETVSQGFLVHTRGGETLRVPTIGDRLREGAFEGDQFFDAACAARAAAHRREPSAARVGLLRGGRSVREWLAGLRAQEIEGYRVAVLGEDELIAALEDPTATEEVRAGAAARLAAIGKDESKRTRIRVASEGIADPKLRVAIDAALSDDDEALESALASLSQRP